LPTDHWTLFDLQHSEHLHVDRSTITVRNATVDGLSYHPDVAVFGMSLPAGAPSAMMNDESQPLPSPPDVRLENCIVRGETSLLRSAEVQGAVLSWSNGVAALSDSLLVIRGGTSAPRNAAIRVDLQHVTVAVGGEGIRITRSFDAPHLPQITVRFSDGLIAALRGKPWFDYDGFESRGEMPEGCEWSAERVVYDGFPANAFWRRETAAGEQATLSFDEWKRYWGMQRELQTAAESIPWQHAMPPTGSLHTVDRSQFALKADAANQRAISGAGDGLDLGAYLSNLREPFAAE
jgi:hypothetical protein